MVQKDSMVTWVCQSYDPDKPSDLKLTHLPHACFTANPLFLTWVSWGLSLTFLAVAITSSPPFLWPLAFPYFLSSHIHGGQADLNAVNGHTGMWCDRKGFSSACHPLVTEKWQWHYIVMARILVTNGGPDFLCGGKSINIFFLFPVL